MKRRILGIAVIAAIVGSLSSCMVENDTYRHHYRYDRRYDNDRYHDHHYDRDGYYNNGRY
ncbi:hypothetical protein MUY27_18100 [Mucilaginibacter sp. RS28]|uniref:Lipoprotein n=1 Tax=Mucilaginibacter straminoryzae TaxID=2932774 RepID=A0A9X2BAP6_9SPHI|nr:hypothetical protein [Mucilaginibacter straminoryzae]MCJ8211636.1 hypothetical protein [Mucilaginibacter straminoryzae]